MAIDIVPVLLGLELLFPTEQSIRDLRLYLQEPLRADDAEPVRRTLSLIHDPGTPSSRLHDLRNILLFSKPELAAQALPLLRIATRAIEADNSQAVRSILPVIAEPERAKAAFNLLAACGVDDPLVLRLANAIEKFPQAPWSGAFSKGQIASKQWLIEQVKELNIHLGNVFIVGGWLGVLGAMMTRDPDIHTNFIRSFDIDPKCAGPADTLNRDSVMNGWHFKASSKDMLRIDYESAAFRTVRSDGSLEKLIESPDTIINTSCDHIHPFSKWWNMIPDGKLVILQNNDFFGADEHHVNNVKTLEEMKRQAPMTELLFAGVLELPQYNRFMLIGKK